MYKFIIKRLASKAGKTKYQPLFEGMLKASLKGMNIGGGSESHLSGERLVVQYIHQRIGNVNDIVIFDVGANVGSYSLMLNEVFGTSANILSFEPSKKTSQKFVTNANGRSNIILYNLGFSNMNAGDILYSNADESGIASVHKRRLDHFNIEMNRSEPIALRTLDSFCSEKGINHIHFLKLDVEGHELKVLEGAKNLLASKSIDFIQFEFGGCNIDSNTFFQDFYYLLKDNYCISRILQDGLYPIGEYKEIYEAFLTTNYLAERIDR